MSDTRGNSETAQTNLGPRLGRRSLPSLLLGIFILWELFYLPAANFIKLLPVRLPPHKGELNDDVQFPADESAGGPAQVVRDGLAFGLSRWGELTGQTQGWALFAPTFGHQASLPMIAFDQPAPGPPWVRLQSSFRPNDPHVYFRLPWQSCRLFNYEYRLVLLYWRWDEKSFYRDHRDEWRQMALERVRWHNRSMLAYMRWRVDIYLREHPRAAQPAIVALLADTIPSPPPTAPNSMRRDGHAFQIAQWFPGPPPPPPGFLPIQAFDLQGGWVWLPEED